MSGPVHWVGQFMPAQGYPPIGLARSFAIPMHEPCIVMVKWPNGQWTDYFYPCGQAMTFARNLVLKDKLDDKLPVNTWIWVSRYPNNQLGLGIIAYNKVPFPRSLGGPTWWQWINFPGQGFGEGEKFK